MLFHALPENYKSEKPNLFRNIEKDHSTAFTDSTLFAAYLILVHYFKVTERHQEEATVETVNLPIYHKQTFEVLELMFKQKSETIRNSLRKNISSSDL